MLNKMTLVQKNSGALHSEGFPAVILRMPKPILSHEQIHWIRTSGLTDAYMARELGVGYVTVHSARRGISFKDHPTLPDTAMRKPPGRAGAIHAIKSDKNCGLPALDFDAIHHIRTSGLPDQVLAQQYGVSRALVTTTRRGRAYTEHPTPPDLFPRAFGQITYTERNERRAPPIISLPYKIADRVVFDRLRLRCRLDQDGCWLWQGSVSGSKPRPSGHHGSTSINGKRMSTHRAMYKALHGEIPNQLHVLHECDKPRCLNPRHLWLGTHLDNMRDSIAKGRHVNVRGKVKPGRSAAEVRLQAGAACQCHGECGKAHTRSRCPQAGPGFRKDRYHIYQVIGQRQYCERCAPGVKRNQSA